MPRRKDRGINAYHQNMEAWLLGSDVKPCACTLPPTIRSPLTTAPPLMNKQFRLFRLPRPVVKWSNFKGVANRSLFISGRLLASPMWLFDKTWALHILKTPKFQIKTFPQFCPGEQVHHKFGRKVNYQNRKISS